MCAVCYSAQYMLLCTVDVCSLLQSIVYADVYSRYVQCVTVYSIRLCVQSMCAVCYNPQYMLICFCLLSYHEKPPKHCQFSANHKVTIM